MTPLEKAAQALKDRLCYTSGIIEGGRAGATDFRDMVRLVIAAIREPSDGMVEAAQTYLDGAKWDGASPEALVAWEIMIDAALTEGSTD
jgi:hypothetical protein